MAHFSLHGTEACIKRLWYASPVSAPTKDDRRRHVRVHPVPDFPVEVGLVDGIVVERVNVVDVSVAGFGLLLEPPFDRVQVGQQLLIRVSVPEHAPLDVAAFVRHVTRATGVWGVEIDRASEQAMRALNHAVSELLERAPQG